MDELSETLNRVLSNPGELERLTKLASQVLGGGAEEAASAPQESGTVHKLMNLATGEDGKARLVSAMVPYLGPERGKKLLRAARLAKMVRLAATVLGEEGRLGDV